MGNADNLSISAQFTQQGTDGFCGCTANAYIDFIENQFSAIVGLDANEVAKYCGRNGGPQVVLKWVWRWNVETFDVIKCF